MAIDKGEHVQAAFLDLSKAYDRVWHPRPDRQIVSTWIFAFFTLLAKKLSDKS